MTFQPSNYLYEVYDKRVLYEDRATLPLLDRTTRLKRARKSANAWGGVVLRLTLAGETVTAVATVYMHRSTPASAREPDSAVVTLEELRRRLYPDGWRLRTSFRKAF